MPGPARGARALRVSDPEPGRVAAGLVERAQGDAGPLQGLAPEAGQERLLLAVPGGVGARQLREALERAGIALGALDETGSHAARFRV
ncbi:hypothetical protein AEGHOMDF_4970 [Methylobacterium soli]|nr:hypothetical protein AEGHOMDF_4970 [Methylobacterium soli]